VIAQGVPGRSVSYEILGPDQWMLHDEARDAVVA
jgi:nitric oxide dioxygenase